MRLVCFDLDGTITYRDTLFLYVMGFLARAHRSRWRLARLLPALAAFSVGAADRGRVKSTLIRATLGGATRAALQAWTAEFVPGVIDRGCSPAVLRMLQAHRDAGDRLVLMSASTDLYVPQLGQALGFHEVICTGVAFDAAGALDGALTTPNRLGAEKVRCFEALKRAHPGLETVAYGNAASDLAHLVLADVPRLVNASARTVRRARVMGIKPFTESLT